MVTVLPLKPGSATAVAAVSASRQAATAVRRIGRRSDIGASRSSLTASLAPTGSRGTTPRADMPRTVSAACDGYHTMYECRDRMVFSRNDLNHAVGPRDEPMT